jgi:hypothetical protein
MSRTSRIATALLAGCGLAVAVAAFAQQTEHRIEIIKHGGPGAVAVTEANLHMAPVHGAGLDFLIARPGPPGMPGGPDAAHGAEIQAALSGPAGALSTPDMLIRHAQQLELSDDQVAVLKALQVVMRKMHVNVSAAIQLAEIDVQAAADVAQPNMDVLEAAFEAVAKAQMDERMLPFRLSREAREELTDGQLSEWDGFLAQRHDANAMHRAHMSMMPGAPGQAANGSAHAAQPHAASASHGDDDDGGHYDRK